MNFKRIFRKCISWFVYIFSSQKRIRNFLLWPIAKRLLGMEYTEEVNIGSGGKGGGIKMKVSQNMPDMVNKILMFYSDRVSFCYEPKTVEVFKFLLKKNNCILVAGAHLGYYALIAAHFNKDSIIYAFEPVASIYRKFVHNIKINGFDNIKAENVALSNITGECDITIDNAQSSLVINGKNKNIASNRIKSVKIDDYFFNKENKPTLLLLDVEGYESFVLDGAEKLLATNFPDIIFEVNLKMIKDQFIKLAGKLKNFGYHLYLIKDDYGDPNPYNINKDCPLVTFDTTDYERTGLSFYNILAIKNDKTILGYLDNYSNKEVNEVL